MNSGSNRIGYIAESRLYPVSRFYKVLRGTFCRVAVPCFVYQLVVSGNGTRLYHCHIGTAFATAFEGGWVQMSGVFLPPARRKTAVNCAILFGNHLICISQGCTLNGTLAMIPEMLAPYLIMERKLSASSSAVCSHPPVQPKKSAEEGNRGRLAKWPYDLPVEVVMFSFSQTKGMINTIHTGLVKLLSGFCHQNLRYST